MSLYYIKGIFEFLLRCVILRLLRFLILFYFSGTSKEQVMKSYENDLQESIASSQTIHKSVLQHFMNKEETKIEIGSSLASNPVLNVPVEEAEFLTVFNSLTRQRAEAISFLIEASKYETICVRDKDNVLLKHQVGPYFNRSVFC